MFNPAILATEVFKILRSYDYTVDIFDFDGNRVYDPPEARRFFAQPKNITVSIHEDGENSKVLMFLSKTTSAREISGLIATMRVTVSKFNVRFNVRQQDRVLQPKDLAPNAIEENHTGDTTMNTLNEKKEVEMIELPALGCSVELADWNAFKDSQYLHLVSAPEENERIPDETIRKLMGLVSKVRADGMSNMLSRVADALSHGSESKLLKQIAQRAIVLAYRPEAVTEAVTETVEEVLAPDAWEKFNSGAVIMTESLKGFGQWFNSLSPAVIFEDERVEQLLRGKHNDGYEFTGDFDQAADLALSTVRENFSVDAFLADSGPDFNYDDDTLTDEDRVLDFKTLRASLVGYLRQEIEDALDGTEYPNENDASTIADEVISDVIATMTEAGWYIEVPESDEAAGEPLDDTILTDEPIVETEDEAVMDDDLTTEDVLLPSDAGQDFAHDVVSDTSQEDVDRIVGLAHGSRQTVQRPIR